MPMCLISLVFDIRLNTLTIKFLTTSETQFWIWIIDLVVTTTAFTCFNTKRKEHEMITLTLTICGITLHS